MALRIQGWCGPGVCGKHGVLGPGLSAKQRVGEAVENTGTLFLLLNFVFFSPRISGLIFALGGNYCCYLKVPPHSTYTFYLGTKIFCKGFLKFLYISTVRHP